MEKNKEIAIFAAGCFWSVQKIFDALPGIISTAVGYTGGNVKNPSYKQVCLGNTGHAEAIYIEFDPQIVRYEILLETFWMNHNPTTLNRQGPDFGEQYRSAIFYTNEIQKKKAVKSMKEYQKKLKDKIVTQIIKATEFFPAEKYHQKYYLNHIISCDLN